MSTYPTARISKIVDPETKETRGYQVAVMSQDNVPFSPGNFRTLHAVFQHGFHNLLSPDTRNILIEVLKVAGPVKVTVGSWMEPIDRK